MKYVPREKCGKIVDRRASKAGNQPRGYTHLLKPMSWDEATGEEIFKKVNTSSSDPMPQIYSSKQELVEKDRAFPETATNHFALFHGKNQLIRRTTHFYVSIPQCLRII